MLLSSCLGAARDGRGLLRREVRAIWLVASEQSQWPCESTLRLPGRVCYLLIKEKVVIVEPEGGTDDGRGSRKMSTLSE